MGSDRKARISGLAGTEHARNRIYEISLPYDRGRSGYEIKVNDAEFEIDYHLII